MTHHDIPRRRRAGGASYAAGAPSGASDAAGAPARTGGASYAARAAPPASGAGATAGGSGLERGYARSRARADAIRAGLEPLGAHERPLGIKLAAGLAAFLAAANLAAALAGAGGESPALGFATAILMAALAAGLWARRYVVILLFQALLAITIIISALSLAFASNALAVVLAVVVVGVCSPIFWLLVRVMARLQVPQR